MIINENRTDSYVATINLYDPDDQEYLKGVRKGVSIANRIFKEEGCDHREYVKLHGRGHRMGVRKYGAELPLRYAKTADIYIYKR